KTIDQTSECTSGGKPPFLTCSFQVRVVIRTGQEGWLAAARHNLDQSQDSLLDSSYLPNRASTQSASSEFPHRPARAAQSDISKSMEVHGGLQSRPESRLPESWNRDHRANRIEANRQYAHTFLYASSCC